MASRLILIEGLLGSPYLAPLWENLQVQRRRRRLPFAALDLKGKGLISLTHGSAAVSERRTFRASSMLTRLFFNLQKSPVRAIAVLQSDGAVLSSAQEQGVKALLTTRGFYKARFQPHAQRFSLAVAGDQTRL